jgi:uncharacterized protein YbjT (DUF2867 family)
MYIVMGATGHVGGAVAGALLRAGREVTVITRDARKAPAGAQVAELDVRDVSALRDAFRRGRRAFVLNPPADPSTDTDREERATVAAILQALEGSGLEYVVAASTYGAQPGVRIGDLSVLYELEQGLPRAVPHVIVRSAYYYTNFDALLEPARAGLLPTMMPAEFTLPMVAPADIGHLAAQLLMEPTERRLVHVEGPERHDFNDVARAFAKALAREVRVEVTPRSEWEASFRQLGFSPEAARAYANMTAATVDGCELPSEPIRGSTTLQAYVDALVAQDS